VKRKVPGCEPFAREPIVNVKIGENEEKEKERRKDGRGEKGREGEGKNWWGFLFASTQRVPMNGSRSGDQPGTANVPMYAVLSVPPSARDGAIPRAVKAGRSRQCNFLVTDAIRDIAFLFYIASFSTSCRSLVSWLWALQVQGKPPSAML
jgi:hypothetical protein